MTLIERVAAMVARVDAAAKGSGVGYTPRLRELERAVDEAGQLGEPSELDASVRGAIRALEVAWNTEIAKARRTAADGRMR